MTLSFEEAYLATGGAVTFGKNSIQLNNKKAKSHQQFDAK